MTPFEKEIITCQRVNPVFNLVTGEQLFEKKHTCEYQREGVRKTCGPDGLYLEKITDKDAVLRDWSRDKINLIEPSFEKRNCFACVHKDKDMWRCNRPFEHRYATPEHPRPLGEDCDRERSPDEECCGVSGDWFESKW